jgi:hypothetical protein
VNCLVDASSIQHIKRLKVTFNVSIQTFFTSGSFVSADIARVEKVYKSYRDGYNDDPVSNLRMVVGRNGET